MTPAAPSTAYFKIGDYVTFVWNFTSLEATPTAVNVMATCKANAQLYTIAVNQTVSNSTQAHKKTLHASARMKGCTQLT